MTDQEWLLRQFINSALYKYPLPWRIEQDWTWEVMDVAGQIVMKCQSRSQAETLLAIAIEIFGSDGID